MWLTDFIPGAEPGIEVPCKLLGLATISAGVTTVPTPACAQDGDFQVIVWTYFTNGSPTWASTDWGTTPDKWKTAAWFAGTNRPAVSFRKITAGNIAQPFRLYQAGGALGVSYCTFIMRNIVSAIDPIMATVTNGTNTLSSASNIAVIDHPGHVPVTSPSDIVIACMSETSVNGNAQMQVPAEDGAGVLSSGTTTRQSFAAGDPPNTSYAVTRLGGLGSIVNMNGSTTDDPLNGWTLSQVERVVGNQGAATTYSVRELALGATGTRYGIYKNFNLTAGKRYILSIDTAFLGGAGSGTSRSAPWFLVQPPSGIANQYGCCWNVQFSLFQQVGGLSGANWMFRHGSTLGSGMWTATFIAAETGVHTLWFGILTSGAVTGFPGSLATHAGSTARVYNGNHITVVEAVTTDVTEVAPYNGLMERLPSSGLYYPTNRTRVAAIYNPYGSGLGSSETFVTARSGSAKRTLASVQLRSHPRVINAPNNGRTIAAQYTGGLNPGGSFIRYSDHIVGPWLATKFYFEITVTAVGSGAVGYAVSSRVREWFTAAFPGAGDNDFGYLSGVATTRTYATQGSTTGLAGWSVGDVIGCLLDYSNPANIRVYFTRNGSAYANSPFPSAAPWSVVGAKVFATDAIDGVATTAQYTMNLTGPFLYPPPDSLPFDFDNPGTPLGYQLFTSSGTFDKSTAAGAGRFVAHVVGGGGGGGSGSVGSRSSTYVGGGEGGGGGGYSVISLPAASVGATETVTVGLGGGGGAAAGPTTGVVTGPVGSNGQASSFGAHVTAGGGTGGQSGWQGNIPSAAQASGGSGTVSTGGGGWRLIPNGSAATCFTTENGSGNVGPGGGGAGGGGASSAVNYSGSKGGDAPSDDVPAGGAGGLAAMATNNGSPSADVGAVNYPLTIGSGGGGGGGNCWYPIIAGSDPTGPSGAGANAGTYGGGGGGGGGGCSYGTGYPGTGGKGGDGASGYVLVVWYA